MTTAARYFTTPPSDDDAWTGCAANIAGTWTNPGPPT